MPLEKYANFKTFCVMYKRLNSFPKLETQDLPHIGLKSLYIEDLMKHAPWE